MGTIEERINQILIEQVTDNDNINMLKVLDFFLVPGSYYRYRVFPILDTLKGELSPETYTAIKAREYFVNGFAELGRAAFYAYLITRFI